MSRDILIVRQDHLGDLVLTTPLIRALDLAGHRVSVLARSSNLPVLEGNPHLRNLIALEKIAPSFPREAWNLGLAVRELAPDLVMVPYAKPTSLLVGLRCGYFGPIFSMWGGIASRLLRCHSLRSRLLEDSRHISDIWLDLSRALHVANAGLKPEIFLKDDEKSGIQGEILRRFGSRRIVVVHPGCSGNTCNLDIDTYAKLINQLLETTEAAIVLSGVRRERELFGKSLECFDDHPRVWNAMGDLELREFCAIISQASLVVSVGTAPLHLASALGIPTVSPFCTRIGVCNRVWGNQGAASLALEPPSGYCAAQSAGQHCNFGSTVTAEDLLAGCTKLLVN